jgi:hypothetical protein
VRYFTLRQAEELIPALKEIFGVVMDLAQQAKAKAEKVQALSVSSVSNAAETALARSQMEFLAREIDRQIQKIADLGVVPKGIEPPLVDFPARIGGREVYLCWKFGESKISFYHGLDEGFSGRKPLPKSR